MRVIVCFLVGKYFEGVEGYKYLVESVVDVVDSASVVGRVVAADVGLMEDLTGRLCGGGGGFLPARIHR